MREILVRKETMERCSEHDGFVKDSKETRETVIRMEEKLDNAIKKVTEHIAGGAKWRLTILCACIGLFSLFIGAVVKFAVNDYRVTLHEEKIKVLEQDNRDINFELGKIAGKVDGK